MARTNRSNTNTSRRTNTAAPMVTPELVPEPVRTPRQEKVYNDSHRITNYTFTYQRDRVSRKAGSSGFAIVYNGSGDAVTMTLQEANSLYNFLHTAINQ